MKLLKLHSAGLFASSLIAITPTPALASGQWRNTGRRNMARQGHTARQLSSGRVLVAGGDRCLHDQYTLCGRCSRLYTGSRIVLIEQTNRVRPPNAGTLSVNE